MTRRPSIRLNSGNYWYFDDPRDSRFTATDIAHNIAKENRFNGANDDENCGYTVAQHAVNASYICAPEVRWEVINHDNAEFAYKDVTTWLKGLLPDYQRQLLRGEHELASRLGTPFTMSAACKLADYQMLKMEKAALFKRVEEIPDEGFYHLEGIDTTGLDKIVDLTPWSPREAKYRWLDRWTELDPQHRSVGTYL